MGRAYRERRTVHIADIEADPSVSDSPGMRSIGARTGLGVPLLRGDEVLGVIVLVRIQVRPFDQREIELVEGFARQSAIAIENVRLFNETQESLERQTAVSDILKVISGSVTDIQPVLDAIAQSAARFAMAEDASVLLVWGDHAEISAHHGPLVSPPSVSLERGWVAGRAAQ